MAEPRRLTLFIDGDACPVMAEAIRVAERHGLPVVLVSNQWRRGADHPLVRQIVVPQGPDKADDEIVELAAAWDVVISQDIPLAARCVAKGAQVLSPSGKILDQDSVGMAKAMRDLMTHLRETGEMTGGPRPFAARDRSQFLDKLESLIQKSKRALAAAS